LAFPVYLAHPSRTRCAASVFFELQKDELKRLKSFSREQNRTLSEIVNWRDASVPFPPKASLLRAAYLYAVKPFHGAAGMKEPRKSPPRKSPTKSEEKLDEELEESFPASDPPSNTTPTSAGGPARRRAKRPAPGEPPQRG
jgi:hypothetical protein